MRPTLSIAAHPFDEGAAARAAWLVAGVLVATGLVATIVLWPELSHVIGPVPAFLHVYAVVIGICEVLATVLLLWRAFSLRTRSATLLAAAYCISAPLVVGNLITLPGVVAPLGTFAHQAPPWCWTLWHLGWAIAIFAYAWLADAPDPSPAPALAVALGLAVAAVVACTHADQILPPLLLQPGDTNSLLLHVLGWTSVAVMAGAAVGLVRRRELALDAWVFVALTALALDLALVLLTTARFSIGTYVARTLGAFNALAVFLAVGVEYVQLARPGGALDTYEAALEATRRSEVEFRELVQTQSRVTHTLQRAVLSTTLPFVEGIQLSASYQPGTREEGIGGNWYDVFVLPNGRVAFTIGDVDDHGFRAATAMVRVREAIRAAALMMDGDPAKTLAAANRTMAFGSPVRASTVFATLDPKERDLAYVSAGHETPYLVRSGSVQPLESEPLVLGSGTTVAFVTKRIGLLSGDAIVLYTAGLFGASTSPAQNEAKLRGILAARPVTPEEIVKGMRSGSTYDDIAVLVARVT